MRKYFFILILTSAGFLGNEVIYAQWISETCPSANNLNAVAVTGKGLFWIAGDSGTVLYKNESAWRVYPVPTSENLYGIYFVNDNNGWAVGAKGTIMHYNGRDWMLYDNPAKDDLHSVSFKDKDNGVAVGKLGTILIYKNGAWNKIQNKYRGNFNIAAYNRNDIWLGGGLECVYFPIIKLQCSRKDALTLIQDDGSFGSINSLYFLNSSNGWAVGSPSILMHYDGQTWRKHLPDEKFSSLKYVYFSDEHTGISVGYNGAIMSYINERWVRETPGISDNLNCAAIYGNTFYAIGDNGTVIYRNITLDNKLNLATDDLSGDNELVQSAMNSVIHPLEKPAVNIELVPNPCDDMLQVKLNSFYNNIEGTLKITNIFGQVVVLKEIVFKDRFFELDLKTGYFENGLYILEVITAGNSTTEKFIVGH